MAPVVLTATPANRVRLWGDKLKKSAIDATTYDPETGIATWADWRGGGDRTIWVEITSESTTVADVTLTLAYSTFVPDIVLATGVWATNTATQFSTKDWAQLAGSVWDTDMDEKLQKRIEDPSIGGAGLRSPKNVEHEGKPKTMIVNVMLMQFTITPADGCHLAGAREMGV